MPEVLAEKPGEVALAPLDEPQLVQSSAKIALRRFRRHTLGMLGLATLIVLYIVAGFADFIAPYDYENETRELQWAPPSLHFRDANGFSWRPFVHPLQM